MEFRKTIRRIRKINIHVIFIGFLFIACTPQEESNKKKRELSERLQQTKDQIDQKISELEKEGSELKEDMQYQLSETISRLKHEREKVIKELQKIQ